MRWIAVLALSAMVLLPSACLETSGNEETAVAEPVTTQVATSEFASNQTGVCDPLRPHEPGEFARTIMSGGLEREYILHIPATYNPGQPTPVVMLFHGFGLDGRIMYDYTEMGDLADREGFIVVSPTGWGDPNRWSSGGFFGDEVDDVQFVDHLLTLLDGELCTDPSRTFATGYSNGGGMSIALACERPKRFLAVGLVASPYGGSCEPTVPMIGFHGSLDSFGGADPQELEAGLLGLVAAWAEALDCVPGPQVEQVSEHVERTTYGECGDGSRMVQFYFVDGGGHTWPGGSREYGDPALTTFEISASELIWEFFSEVGS